MNERTEPWVMRTAVAIVALAAVIAVWLSALAGWGIFELVSWVISK